MAAKGMVDMKRTKAEKAEREKSWDKPSSGEDYPYGLSVSLDHDGLTKLGMGEGKMPKVGSKIMLHAHAHVKSTSESSRDGGNKDRRMELELRHMSLEHGADGVNEKPAPDSDSIGKGMKAAMDKAVPGPNRTKRGTEVDSDPEE